MITNAIAKIEEPKKVSLTNNPNYITFENRSRENNTPVYIELKINNCGCIFYTDTETGNTLLTNATTTTIVEKKTGKEHQFEGTLDLNEVNETRFYLGPLDETGFPAWHKSRVAESFKNCLGNHPFFKNKFDIQLPPETDENGVLRNGATITIRSRGCGDEYAFSIEENAFFSTLKGDPMETENNDSILDKAENCEIVLDIYKDTGVALGTADYKNMGTYITTLSKSYFGEPLWFDVNTIWANRNTYSNEFLAARGWCRTGTVTDFRFVAKRHTDTGYETIYHSDVLYALTGYARTLEKVDMLPYIYDASAGNTVTPLTKQLELTHIRGQRQYFNFILSCAGSIDEGLEIGILYKVYTQSGSYLGKKIGNMQPAADFDDANTLQLDIDSILDAYPQAGIVKAFLCSKLPYEELVVQSEPMTFSIMPDCLYKVNDFAFLNSLGGWSSFNFGGMVQTDFKTDNTTIYSTQTPQHDTSSSIESVFNKAATEQFIAQTLPVNAGVAEWLKELSASVAVYELSSGRYVIVDELNVKHNTKDDLFTLQMKYHYSDSYNAGLN